MDIEHDHPLYASWKAMMRSCYDPDAVGYPYIGGKQIEVCKDWHQFENFVRDMEEKRPDDSTTTLARRNHHGHFTPRNCYWRPVNSLNGVRSHSQLPLRQITQKDRREILNLRNQGHTLRQLAQQFHTTVGAVMLILHSEEPGF